MKTLQPAVATATSHITSVTFPRALQGTSVGTNYIYGIIDGAHFDIYTASGLLLANETLRGTITSTLATPIAQNIVIYDHSPTYYIVATFKDGTIAAGGNDYEVFACSWTLVGGWVAIDSLKWASGVAAAGRKLWVVDVFENSDSDLLTLIHYYSVGGDTKNYLAILDLPTMTNRGTSASAAAATNVAAIGGWCNGGTDIYYYAYYEDAVFTLKQVTVTAALAVTFAADATAITNPTVSQVPHSAYSQYGQCDNDRVIVTQRDLEFYNARANAWTLTTRATTNYNCAVQITGVMSYIYWDIYVYYRCGNTWALIYNSLTAAQNKSAACRSIAVINATILQFAITTETTCVEALVQEQLHNLSKMTFKFTLQFTPFTNQVLLVYNDNDELIGPYQLGNLQTTGGYQTLDGIYLGNADLTRSIDTTITTQTPAEHAVTLQEGFCNLFVLSTVWDGVTDYTLSYNAKFGHALFLLAALESGVFYWDGTGNMYLDHGTTDSGDDLLFGTNFIIHVWKTKTYKRPLDVTCKGGYVDGVQLSYTYPIGGIGDPLSYEFSGVDVLATLTTLATNIGTLMNVAAEFYTVKYLGATRLQVGQQITFAYSPLSIASAQYYVMGVRYNLVSDVNEVDLCSHLIYPEMHLLTTNLDQYVGVLQSDVNNPTGAGITPASLKLPTGATIVEISTDGTMVGNSDTVVPTEKAVVTYVAAAGGGGHTDEEIQDLVGAMVSGNTETGIAVTYEDGDGTLDFVITKGALTGTSPVTMSAARETIGGAVDVSIVNDAAAAVTQFDTADPIPNTTTLVPCSSAVYLHNRIYMTADNDGNYHYRFTSATNGGTVVLDLTEGAETSTETNCTQTSADGDLTTLTQPTWATHVLVEMHVTSSTANVANYVTCKTNGQVNNVEAVYCYTGSVAAYYASMRGWVKMDANDRIIFTVGRGAGTITCNVSILGWGRFSTS